MAMRDGIQKLVFRTVKEGDKTYCGVKGNGGHLLHRFVNERNSHGHNPGYIYLTYLPVGPHKGCYHIGKAEYTTIGSDDFDLEAIHLMLLEQLRKRISQYHPAKTVTDKKYDKAQFVHGIRVACGEGAEKQPHHFFRRNKLPGGELFDLDEEDVNIFKQAEGNVLDRPIEHLSAESFAGYLQRRGMSAEIIRQWVLLPNSQTRGRDRISAQSKEQEYIMTYVGKPPTNAEPLAGKRSRGNRWYTVDGVEGVELPTLFLRCIHSLRNHGVVNVALRQYVSAEETILRFIQHWRYSDYTKMYQVTPDEWETIFHALRSASSRKKRF